MAAAGHTRDDGGMAAPGVPLAGLLPDRHAWTPVANGESGAVTLRHVTASRFAKVVPIADASALEAERDRTAWLADSQLPGTRVLDWRTSDDGACLVTTAVAGLSADRLEPAELERAWPSITDTLASLHGIPADTCAYSRTLEEMMAMARATVAEDRVHREFLPEHLLDTPPQEILDSLERDLPLRRGQEKADAVVCHGDFCLPNMLIDPEASTVAGLIDLGRLGRADPYADIALLLANARETWDDEAAARRADDDFAARYGVTLDPERLDFYLRLDPLTW